MEPATNRWLFEKKLWGEGYTRIMGLDEVGRGCLAGPVVAAGVILDEMNENLEEGLKNVQDSKNLDLDTRNEMAEVIKQEAMFWTVQESSPAEIDRYNILKASLLTMQKCVDTEGAVPDYLLVDGNKYLDTILPHSCLVKGDNRSVSIGAASILAKVYRDELMWKLHEQYPYYGWNTNVGYPTQKHYEGLKVYGISPCHRRKFNLKTQRELKTD